MTVTDDLDVVLLGRPKPQFAVKLFQLTCSLQVMSGDRGFTVAPCHPATTLKKSQRQSRRSPRPTGNLRHQFFMNVPAKKSSSLKKNGCQFFDAVELESQNQSATITKRLKQAIFVRGAEQEREVSEWDRLW